MSKKHHWLNHSSAIILLISLFWIDLLTKYLFYDLQIYKNSYWIEPAMNLWISFSWNIPYFIVIPVSLVVLWVFLYLYHTNAFSKLVTSFLIAGTLGNMYDRIVYQWVRDFLVFPDMFIFNIADILLTLWMILAIRHIFLTSNNQK